MYQFLKLKFFLDLYLSYCFFLWKTLTAKDPILVLLVPSIALFLSRVCHSLNMNYSINRHKIGLYLEKHCPGLDSALTLITLTTWSRLVFCSQPCHVKSTLFPLIPPVVSPLSVTSAPRLNGQDPWRLYLSKKVVKKGQVTKTGCEGKLTPCGRGPDKKTGTRKK